MSGKSTKENATTRSKKSPEGHEKPISLAPLEFEEAVGALLRVAPAKSRKKAVHGTQQRHRGF